MPLSSRSGTMKCVLLRTMSGTDNPVDRYLPVSSATCNSLVVIIGPPKKWNLCSILSLEGRIFFVWNFLSAGFQKKSTFFFIRDCFQKKSTFFYMRLPPCWFSTFFLYETVFKRSRLFLYETSSLLVFKRSRLFFYTRLFSKEVDFFFFTRLFSKEVDFLREGSDTWGPILHTRGVWCYSGCGNDTRGVWCYSGCGNDKHPWLDLPLIYVHILESIRL